MKKCFALFLVLTISLFTLGGCASRDDAAANGPPDPSTSATDPAESNGILLMGTYSKKSPYNTCAEAGVNECVIWGDYFYMEALHRLLDPDWHPYW